MQEITHFRQQSNHSTFLGEIMNWKRILCPVDLSQPSTQSIAIASSLARENNGEVIFLYVTMPELPPSAGLAIAEVDQAIELEREALRKIRPSTADTLHRHELTRGLPANSIVQYAKLHNIDLIVMPTHGRQGISRLLLGSVAEQVLRTAPCPVLTIKSANTTELSAPIAERTSSLELGEGRS
jgi:nucleotide-binding universal stress UspA family protein